jgi:hypothetical protein
MYSVKDTQLTSMKAPKYVKQPEFFLQNGLLYLGDTTSEILCMCTKGHRNSRKIILNLI